ncbi:MAG: hypothetical protein ACJAYU_004519 [Bradymonadia bacterium]
MLIGGVGLYVVLIAAALATIAKNLRSGSSSSGLGAALSLPHLLFEAIGVVSVVVDGFPQPSQPDYALILAVDSMAAGSLVVGLLCAFAAWRARG